MAGVGLLGFWAGLYLASRHFPSEFDWRYMTISSLLYPERDPRGYVWAWGGIVACALGGLCWVSELARNTGGHERRMRPGIWSLTLGYACMVGCAFWPGRLLHFPRGHDLLALLAFVGVFVGILHLTYVRAEQVLLAGAAVLPLLLEALTQADVARTFPHLPWVGLEWRARGVPAYLSFAFWEWITCVVFSVYIAGLSLLSARASHARSAIGCRRAGRTRVDRPTRRVQMQSTTPRVAVITGASSGIGLATAKALAAQGWRIIGQGRDPERTSMAASAIEAAALPGVSVEMLRGDLSLVRDAARLADEIAARTERIDALLNNAGGAPREQVVTAEGNEATFAGNHLGHFVLTNRLLPLLKSTASRSPRGATRIINVSSAAHEVTKGLDWDDLQMLGKFVPIRAYCNAKLANILFTRSLAQQLESCGVAVHAMHPGAVDTNFVNRADQSTQKYMRTQNLLSAEQGADTLIWLATAAAPGDGTGQYFHNRVAVAPSAAALDSGAAARLWQESERLAAAADRARL